LIPWLNSQNERLGTTTKVYASIETTEQCITTVIFLCDREKKKEEYEMRLEKDKRISEMRLIQNHDDPIYPLKG
jgi:hypothetical protein